MKNSSLFKIVALYQYAENYASWDWDGKGDCPQGWKMKGGVDEILVEGVDSDMAQALMQEAWINEKADSFSYSNDYSQQYLAGINIVPLDSLGWMDEQEALWVEDWEWLELHHCNIPEWAYIVKEADENAPLDRFDAIAESLGFLNV